MPEYGLPVETIDMLSEISADKSGRDGFQVVDQFAQFNRGAFEKAGGYDLPRR